MPETSEMKKEEEKETSKATEEKADTTPAAVQGSSNTKDDCSDLTGDKDDPDDQAPKTFPQKLMEILSDEEHSNVISWLPHGNGFIIHKKKTFANEVLPKYFKASKFTSFTRKLNRWGFSRVPRGPETGSYYHKLFLRDKPELCLQMTSNSGNKYQQHPLQQPILPNVPGMMGAAGSGGMPAMFPYIPPQMMTNMPPQQQQAMWQQQMQMLQFQQMQMMQMQQQQQQQQQAVVDSGGTAPVAPNAAGGVGVVVGSSTDANNALNVASNTNDNKQDETAASASAATGPADVAVATDTDNQNNLFAAVPTTTTTSPGGGADPLHQAV